MKPFLKWNGSKIQLLGQITELMPNKFHGQYFEPFLGSGALFFHTQFPDSFLIDCNRPLIETYKAIRDTVESVVEVLQDHTRLHSLEHYKAVRDIQYKDRVLAAARFIYLNRTCFNGLYRENSKGLFNVPIGDYKNPTICNTEILREASHVLQHYAKIYHGSFDIILNHVQPGDFVYLDPPYLPVSKTSNFASYNSNRFDQYDHIRLASFCRKLTEKDVMWIQSNSDCDMVKQLYQQYEIKTVTVNRRSSAQISGRGQITELLIRNY